MKYSFLLVLLALLISCGDSNKTQLTSQIESVTEDMRMEDFPSNENMSKIIDLYDEYIFAYPEDSETYSYMELKAKYQAASADYKGSILTYDQIIEKYPEDEKTADAVFMQAFIYENNLNDKKAAKEKYEIFLKDYPEHELAKDARFSIENLYLTDEQIFQKIMQMQQDTLAE